MLHPDTLIDNRSYEICVIVLVCLFWHQVVTVIISVCLLPWRQLFNFMSIYMLASNTLTPFCRLVSCSLVIWPVHLTTAGALLCCIDFQCTPLVSLCCYSGVWCAALPIICAAPVPAAGITAFDGKHLDGSHSASGFTLQPHTDPHNSHVTDIMQT